MIINTTIYVISKTIYKQMKKILFSIFALLTAVSARADEGMWVLSLLAKMNIGQMQQMGCKLSAEEIYSANNTSLKDAIIIFGSGCTGEIVSDKGLIFTNHHCGYGSIQQLSSVEHNYLRDGFWAKSHEEELPVPGLQVRFMTAFEDVTDIITEGLDNASAEVRQNKVNERSSKLQSDAMKALSEEEKEYTEVRVESFLSGNQFFKVTYNVYNDIRFVGAPPVSIGKFGHDTDNWMWPRHTGDFSIFRVYMSKDGKPASFSTENVPLKPKHHLPVSLAGIEMNDFAMTIGFPGSTDRYLSSWGIEETMNVVNASRILPRETKQNVWMADMQADEKINIQYASKYARSSNYWKNAIGMNRGLNRLHILDKKRAIEADFAKYAESHSEYANVLSSLAENYASRAADMKAYYYLRECVGSVELLSANASPINALVRRIESGKEVDAEFKSRVIEAYRAIFKDYSAKTDEKACAALLDFYAKNVDAKYLPAFYQSIAKKYKNNYVAFAASLFKNSILADSTKLFKFIEKPNLKQINKDIAFLAAKDLQAQYQQLRSAISIPSLKVNNAERLFLKGLMEMNPEKNFYSDANFTMRLSYGVVGDYESADAVHYKHFTTLKGVMEKEKPGDWEFDVPAKLKELYNTKNYGRYADKDGEMHVCFTTNNDITGGNSGSPVINGKGQLIGLAFDGNWEAMSGDIAFETELQKCICVDIRYVLFIIEKYGDAKNIIDELTFAE